MENGDDARTGGQGNESQAGDMMTQRAPPTDGGLREPRANIETIRPKRVGGAVHTEPLGAAGLAPDMSKSTQQLEDIQELMRLKETDPDQFNTYVQMAADAAQLAKEQPEVFQALMQETAAGGGNLTAARAEQARAMDAASHLNDATGDSGNPTLAGNLPGGRKLETGGTRSKPAGIMVYPRPGFAIKTKVLDTGVKVFVNVCQHERIGESGMAKKLDKDGLEVEGMNIPISVGPPTVDKDNAGAECIVYDVIVNPKTVEECQADKTGAQRDWVCHLVMQSVMSKHDCRLDPKYKLPKLTFKGSKESGPAQQRIRDDSLKPHISEVERTRPASSASSTPTAHKPSKGTRTPATRAAKGPATESSLKIMSSSTMALWKGAEGETEREVDVGATSLEQTVRVPPDEWPDSLLLTVMGIECSALASDLLDEIEVEASAYECVVQVLGHRVMRVRVPYTVLPDAAASVLANPHDSTLAIRLTVDKSPPSQQADVGSKAWLLSRALDGGGGEERKAAEEGGDGARRNVSKMAQEKATAASAGVLPEDQFHLKLPKGVNQYTGAVEDDPSDNIDLLDGLQDEPIQDRDELPEDRFHQADIVSQHMIDTRQKQRVEKIERAERERNDRKKEPQDGVEYIDFDDYRAGGKLAPSRPQSSAENVQGQLQAAGADGQQDPKPSEDMEAAARVLRNVVEGKGKGKGKQGGNATDVGSNLSTSFWTDLLD